MIMSSIEEAIEAAAKVAENQREERPHGTYSHWVDLHPGEVKSEIAKAIRALLPPA